MVYARISEDRGGEADVVKRQIRLCLELAERDGLTVVDVIEENDTSAYSSKPRTGWRRVVAMAKAGSIDGIVAYASDRLYRRMLDLEEIIDLVEDRKLVIYTVAAGRVDLSTPDGRQVARLIAAVARGESERMAMRIAEGHKARAKLGGWKGGRRPWGYHKDGLTVYELEADALILVANRVLQGMTLKAAAQLFNDLTKESEYRKEDPKTKRILPEMSGKVLRDILIGYRIVGKRIHVPQEKRTRYARSRAASKDVIPAPWRADDLETVKALWPAILDEETWRALRTKILHPGLADVRIKRPEMSMLSGLLKCGECAQGRGPDGVPTMVSLGSGQKSYTCGRCGRVGINKTTVEALIEKEVERALTKINDALPESNQLASPAAREAAMSEQERLDGAEQTILNLIIDGKTSEDRAAKALDEIKQKRAALTVEDDRRHRAKIQRSAAVGLISAWKEAPDPVKRQVIALVADHFIVDRVARSGRVFQPGRVRAKWASEEEPVRLGAEPIAPEDTERATAERKLRRAERDRKYRESPKGKAAAAKRKKIAMGKGA